MTRLSVLEDAKVKIAAYESMTFPTDLDEIIKDLLDSIKGLVDELECLIQHSDQELDEYEWWKV